MYLLISALIFGSLTLLTFLIVTRDKDGNQTANRWFGVFLIGCTGIALDNAFFAFGIYRQMPHLIGISDILFFIIAPSFFLSVRCFTFPAVRVSWQQGLHFIPALLFAWSQLSFFLTDAPTKSDLLSEALDTWNWRIFFYILLLQFIIYMVLSLLLLHQHQHHIRLFAATLEPIHLHWLQRTAYGTVFLALLWFGDQLLPFFESIARVGYVFGIFYVAHYSLNQRVIFPFSKEVKAEIAALIETADAPKSEKRKLFSAEELDLRKAQLLQWMELEKPYLENDLSLPSLAQQLQLSTNELSYLLNEGFSENFFQFINRYRVEESKRLLSSPAHAHLNMLGIAYEAGFNSKTVFNTHFKKVTGISPSEFRQTAIHNN